MVQVFESNAGANFNQLVEYAVNSVACFFFMTALIFQILEWDLITQMVHHQGTNHLNMLEIQKDDYRASEMKKWTITKIILGWELGYDLTKVVMLCISYAECADPGSKECQDVIN